MLTAQLVLFRQQALATFPKLFIRDGEEFDGSTTPKIWTTGETGIFRYDYDRGNHYVHPKMQALLDKYGLYYDWYDTGTVMIYEA